MNEREFSLIRTLGEESSEALGELRESFRKSLDGHIKGAEGKLTVLTKEVSTLKDAMTPDFIA